MGHYAKRMELLKKEFLTGTEERLLEAFRFDSLVSEGLVSVSKGKISDERLFETVLELLTDEFADTFYDMSEVVDFTMSVNLTDADKLLIDYSMVANTSASLARVVLAEAKDASEAAQELRELFNDL